MSFTRLTENLDIIQGLDDLPNVDGGLTAQELKAKFDTAGNKNKDAFNGLIDELEGELGASQIGANDIYEGDASNPNIQGKLEHLHEEIQGVILGAIPDGSLTAGKLESTFKNSLAKKEDLGLLYLASKHTLLSTDDGGTTSYVTPSLTTDNPQGYTVTLEEGYADYINSVSGERTVRINDLYTMIGSSGNEYITGDGGTSRHSKRTTLKIQFPKATKLTNIHTTTTTRDDMTPSSTDCFIYASIYASNDGSSWVTLVDNKYIGDSKNKIYSNIEIPTPDYYNYYRITFRIPQTAYYYKIYNNMSFNGTTVDSLEQNYTIEANYANETLENYVDGQKVCVKMPSNAPTGNAINNTLKIYGLSAKSIPNDLEPNGYYSLIYNGTEFVKE